MNAGAYGGEIAQILKSSVCLTAEGEVKTLSAAEHSFGYRDSIYKHRDWIVLEATFSLAEGDPQAIGETMNDYMRRRVEKQPLEYPSAGSVFKRCQGHFTGQMIEEAGLKGTTIGGAQVSEKHAGFIINLGDATAADVKALVAYIQQVILEKFGCQLECEVIFVK